MTHYFIREGQDEIGPFTREQLKYRRVSKETPVWFAGLNDWTTAEHVYELKEIFVTAPPSVKFGGGWLSRAWKSLFKKKKTFHVALSKDRKHLN